MLGKLLGAFLASTHKASRRITDWVTSPGMSQLSISRICVNVFPVTCYGSPKHVTSSAEELLSQLSGASQDDMLGFTGQSSAMQQHDIDWASMDSPGSWGLVQSPAAQIARRAPVCAMQHA